MTDNTAQDHSSEVEVSPSEVKLPRVSVAILTSAIIFTILWLVSAGIIAWSASPPEEPMGLNEWGDFVAGVSAPIAFIWLVVAVALQSIELREQRKELALTRAEFRSSRAVMKAQADEAKRQAEYIEQQTNLLVEEKDDRHFASIYDANIGRISTRLRQYPNAWQAVVVEGYDPAGQAYGSDLSLRAGKFSDLDNDYIIPHSVKGVRTNIRELKATYEDRELGQKFPYDFQRLYVAVMEGADRISALPELYRTKADTLELDELKTQLAYIADRTGSKPFTAVSDDHKL
jgi:hypothetical protein